MLNIALDGPSGSGKSTIAKALSKKLNILYLDTGAMYRACALKAHYLGIDCKNKEAVDGFIDSVNVEVKYVDGAQRTYLDGVDVSTDIRKNEVSMFASQISSLSIVRNKMLLMQREVASKQDCVLDGRDICMYVLPNAKYKFFMTADANVRAERRYKELLAKGQNVAFDDLLREINERDYNDSHRDFAPLAIAPDATVIDTTNLNAEQVVEIIIKLLYCIVNTFMKNKYKSFRRVVERVGIVAFA